MFEKIFLALGNDRPQILVQLEDRVIEAIVAISEGKPRENAMRQLYSQLMHLEKALSENRDALTWFNLVTDDLAVPSPLPPSIPCPSSSISNVIQDNFQRQMGGLATPPLSRYHGSRKPCPQSPAPSEKEVGGDLMDSSEDEFDPLILAKSMESLSTRNGVESDSNAAIDPKETVTENGVDGGILVKSKARMSTDNGREGETAVSKATVEDEDDPMQPKETLETENGVEVGEGGDPNSKAKSSAEDVGGQPPISKVTLGDEDDPMEPEETLATEIGVEGGAGGDPTSKTKISAGDGGGEPPISKATVDGEDDPMEPGEALATGNGVEGEAEGDAASKAKMSAVDGGGKDSTMVGVVTMKYTGPPAAPQPTRKPLDPTPFFIQTTNKPGKVIKRVDSVDSSDDQVSDSPNNLAAAFELRRSSRLAPKTQPSFTFVASPKRNTRKRKPAWKKDEFFFQASFYSSYPTKAD
jgi:hypothetical protein